MTARTVRTLTALAPGKVVLWGEYAVLAGAPALVMAVDRYARCTIGLCPPDATANDPATMGWHFSSKGFVAESVVVARTALCASAAPLPGSPAWTAWHVLRALDPVALPDAAEVVIDTEGFYHAGAKLGLGSSAAVCVALHGALCELLGAPASYPAVADVHHRLQGNRGSGIDVAAAWFGGLLRFQRTSGAASGGLADVRAVAFPADLQVRFVWAGHPAVTTEHLARFERWRERRSTPELGALTDASAALFEAGDRMQPLRDYVRCLGELDRAADLAIYDTVHRDLHRLAADNGVVYKPCGAGGGDIGAAFSYDARALERFTTSAHTRGCPPITLETAAHGIEVRR